MAKKKRNDRVAIVAGLRTPFAKQLTAFRNMSALEMGQMVVAEMLSRVDLDPSLVDAVIYGQVVPSVQAPNIAREIVLGTGMDRSTQAHSVSMACATSFRSTASAAEQILAGSADIVVAGGADSASDVPITVSKKLGKALVDLSKAKSLRDRVEILGTLRPRDLVPEPPSPKEYSTGKTMGEHAEDMAKDHGISREEQDEFAHRSHTLAAEAWESGKLDDEVMTAFVPPYDESIHRDNLVRFDSELERYAELRPVFDKKHGTLTAANSSPLTDGASAVLVMTESKAKELGLEPLGFIRSWAFAALDPRQDMLLGPSYASPLALQRAKKKLSDMDLVDMHEAFSAQILCNLKMFESKQFAKEELGKNKPIGEVDMDTFNVNGGSIAFGHPFAATGARIITQTLRELKRRDGGLALTTACAAGGLGAAMVLEVD